MVCQSIPSLIERDIKHVWHPFTQHEQDALPILIARGKGSYLYTEKNEPYLDAISSWWTNLHGHCHPKIVQAIASQAERLEHVLFAGFTHPSAIELAERLVNLLSHFSKVFFSDNGSTAVETALKMAIQYWHNQEIPKKRIITFKGGYHGDTFGAMSAAGKQIFSRPFWPYLFEITPIDPPFPGFERNSLAQLEAALAGGEAACFLYEPLIQGVGGMRIHSQEGLERLLKTCRESHTLLIADEVMTGFGRTGPLFASERCPTQPDILCLSKGITGGFLPLGATLCHKSIFEAFLSKKRSHALLHGHSYTANPLACAAALASLELLQEKNCAVQREKIAKQHARFCSKWKGHPFLKRCETLGTILALEFAGEEGYEAPIRDRLLHHFSQKKIILRPLGNILYILPPYCIQEDELNFIYQSMEELWH